MANQDHVFVKIGMVRGKADSIAVARTDRKGTPLCSYTGAVSMSDDFATLVSQMKREILLGQSKEYVVVAHYPEVERTILAKEEHQGGRLEVFDGRVWISTSQLVWPMVDCQMIPSTSFDSVRAYFGIAINEERTDPAATCEEECTALARIYFELMRRYRSALLVEEGVRDFGGPTLDKFRKMIGL
jgi:hypothetical protein